MKLFFSHIRSSFNSKKKKKSEFQWAPSKNLFIALNAVFCVLRGNRKRLLSKERNSFKIPPAKLRKTLFYITYPFATSSLKSRFLFIVYTHLLFVSVIHPRFHSKKNNLRHQLCIIINAKKGMKITAEVFTMRM